MAKNAQYRADGSVVVEGDGVHWGDKSERIPVKEFASASSVAADEARDADFSNPTWNLRGQMVAVRAALRAGHIPRDHLVERYGSDMVEWAESELKA